MRGAPAVSVIIPTYQRASLVGNAVRSVLSQSYTDREIIVVDDGSTDDTSGVLSLFGDAIRVVRQSNQGLSAARNAGIQASVGHYLAFLDDDDEWMPDRLKVQVALLDANDQIGLAFANMDAHDEAGRFLGHWFDYHTPPPLLSVETLFLYNYIPVLTVIVRRSVLDDVGWFDTGLDSCEDYDLWLRVIAGHRVHKCDERLARYRQSATGMSRDATRMLFGLVRVKEMALERNPGVRRLPLKLLDRHCFQAFDQLEQYLDKQGDADQAAAVAHRQCRLRRLCAEGL
jgi:glycosyltransferase involved in cell wall biosynthesis